MLERMSSLSISSDNSPPAFMISFVACPTAEPVRTAASSIAPVARWSRQNLGLISWASVPLPRPGALSNVPKSAVENFAAVFRGVGVYVPAVAFFVDPVNHGNSSRFLVSSSFRATVRNLASTLHVDGYAISRNALQDGMFVDVLVGGGVEQPSRDVIAPSSGNRRLAILVRRSRRFRAS